MHRGCDARGVKDAFRILLPRRGGDGCDVRAASPQRPLQSTEKR